MSAIQTATITKEVAERFNELAQQEKWFEIQEEFFADTIRSIDPPNSPYLGYAEGRSSVRKKGEDFVKRIEAVHSAYTSEPIVAGKYIAVAMGMDCTYKGMGRQQMDEIVLYEVKDGKIVKEQFFY